jgi:sigma-B regulation protein RsbU (phosphoserine phosphatase)
MRWRRWALRLDEEKQIHEQEREIVLQFMHSFVDAVGEGVGREELFRRVVHSAVISTGALSACVFEVRSEELVAVAVEGLFPPQNPLPRGTSMQLSTRARFIEGVLRAQRIPLGQGIVGSVAVSGKGVLLSDASQDPRIVRMDDPALATHSLIVVPIRFQDRKIAVLAIANPADGTPFSQSDFSLAMGIAEQSGLAIHNLDLMEAQIERNKMDVDLALASSIQAMLLPKSMPDRPALDVAPLYLPAQKVGGDLYDVFTIDDNRIGLAIADVSGKGVPASILMAICQSNLRHLARSGISPARVLSDLNSIMREEMRRDMFVTMLYAIVDTAEDIVTIARAGHELPLMLRRAVDGRLKPQFIRSDGMALGMAKEKLFDKVIEEKTIPFSRGEILVMYTDGITETANQQGAQYGSERLVEALEELEDLPAGEINRKIFERVVYFSEGRGQGDDVTMLTIKHL